MPLRRRSVLAGPRLAGRILALAEGVLGEIVTIVTSAAVEALRSGTERSMSAPLKPSVFNPPRSTAMPQVEPFPTEVTPLGPEPSEIPLFPRLADPFPGEALPGWLARFAAPLQIAPALTMFRPDEARFMADPGWWRHPSQAVIERLTARTGLTTETVCAMTFNGWQREPADRQMHYSSRGRIQAGRRGTLDSNHYRVCPDCLHADSVPYVRKTWCWLGRRMRRARHRIGNSLRGVSSRLYLFCNALQSSSPRCGVSLSWRESATDYPSPCRSPLGAPLTGFPHRGPAKHAVDVAELCHCELARSPNTHRRDPGHGLDRVTL